jgi:hypothetical protein
LRSRLSLVGAGHCSAILDLFNKYFNNVHCIAMGYVYMIGYINLILTAALSSYLLTLVALTQLRVFCLYARNLVP